MAQRDRLDLQAVLRGSVVPLSVKALKKKGVRRVKVIERERLIKALVQAVEQKLSDRPASNNGIASETPTEKKRVELLLVELERVSKAKTSIEHEKGLLEAERSRLSSELALIAQEVSKGTGHKVKPEEVRNLLEELERVREDRNQARKTLDRTITESEHRIEAEVARALKAEDEVASLRARVAQFEAQHETLVPRSARLDEAEAEVARLSEERDRLAEKNLQLQRDCQKFEASFESALHELQLNTPFVLAWKEQEAKKAEDAKVAAEAAAVAAVATQAAKEKAGRHDLSAHAPEASPRANPAASRPIKSLGRRPTIPGFGFGDAGSPPTQRESQSRGGFSAFTPRSE